MLPVGVFVEALPPGALLLRAGPGAFAYGHPYEHTVVAVPRPWKGPVVKLTGYAIECGSMTPSLIDGIERELALLGYRSFYFDRIQGARKRRFTIHIKERYMSVQAALAHEIKVYDNVAAHATKNGHSVLVAALQTLQPAVQGLAAAANDMRAYGPASADVWARIADVVDTAMEIGKDPIHSDVANLFNAIDGIDNQVRAGFKSAMHQAVAQLTA